MEGYVSLPSVVTLGLSSRRNGITAIDAHGRPQDRRRAAHTSLPPRSGHRVRTQPPCSRKESATGCPFPNPSGRCRIVPFPLPRFLISASVAFSPVLSFPSPSGPAYPAPHPTALCRLRSPVHIDPLRHFSGTGLGLVGDSGALFPCDLLGKQHLCRTRRASPRRLDGPPVLELPPLWWTGYGYHPARRTRQSRGGVLRRSGV